jgi:hypothetical protein
MFLAGVQNLPILPQLFSAPLLTILLVEGYDVW